MPNSYKHCRCQPENNFCHRLQFSLPSFMLLFFRLSPVKPRWMTVSMDIQCHVGFGSVNGSRGFTEAKPLFSFDNWIVLRVSHELLLLQVKQLKTATAKMNCFCYPETKASVETVQINHTV